MVRQQMIVMFLKCNYQLISCKILSMMGDCPYIVLMFTYIAPTVTNIELGSASSNIANYEQVYLVTGGKF